MITLTNPQTFTSLIEQMNAPEKRSQAYNNNLKK